MEHHNQLAHSGYVYLPAVLTEEEIRSVNKFFQEISRKDAFQKTNYYINTICFEDAVLRRHIQLSTLNKVKKALGRIVDLDKATFPLGAGICINPAHSVEGSRPHQDPTQVQETASYSMTLWIALTDCTIDNGCIHLIPGSHLWGNIRRSGSIQWVFDDYTDDLWDLAVPLPVKAGDILCFDVSTIHCSTPNRTDEARLGLSVTTIPAERQMINYFPVKGALLKTRAELFEVDGNYFLNEAYNVRPSKKYRMIRIENFDNYFTRKQIWDLNAQYKASQKDSIDRGN